jgi:fatty acid desaturase
VTGRDPEMMKRPTLIRMIYLSFINVFGPSKQIKGIFSHVLGKITPDEKDFIPKSEFPKVIWEARIYMLIFITVIGISVYTLDIRPILYIATPLVYGSWLILLYGLPQHAGLHEDVLDHRLNSRTIYLNPFLRFLYLNMNYHIEHHMFPVVPYYALRKLHEEMQHDCPAPNPNLWSAVKEVFHALSMQGKDPLYVVERPIPETANPYFYGPAPFLQIAKQSLEKSS